MVIRQFSVAREYTTHPGPRYIHQGDFSGEALRAILVAALKDTKLLVVDLDGTAGFGSSFLDEAFAGLVRHGSRHGLTKAALLERLSIVSAADPSYRTEVETGMKNAKPTEPEIAPRLVERKASTLIGCIIIPRAGDGPLFSFGVGGDVVSLNGYAVVPIEEYEQHRAAIADAAILYRCPTCGGSGLMSASAAAMRGAPMGELAIGACVVCKGSGRIDLSRPG